MILSSRTHYAIALTFLQDAAEANLTLEEKRLLQRGGPPVSRNCQAEQRRLRPRKVSPRKRR